MNFHGQNMKTEEYVSSNLSPSLFSVSAAEEFILTEQKVLRAKYKGSHCWKFDLFWHIMKQTVFFIYIIKGSY